jgi:photosystem II stability/assembly factor-like uncharacterized protein
MNRGTHAVPGLWSLALLAVGAALGVPATASAETDTFRDPLDTPAAPTRLASATQSTGLARVGARRVVAVGVRGLIIVSDDGGDTWRQVPAPVSSDLLTVRFVDAAHGWAGGHDGVVLVSNDGGDTWSKLLDGRQAGPMLVEHLTRLAGSGDPQAQVLLREVRRNFENGPEMPVLDLWFDDPQHGWAVGAFGTIIGTADGGRTWQSWVEKVDNAKMLHYHEIAAIDGDVYMPSEQGIVFKLDRGQQRFQAQQTGYAGSFFGVVGTREFVLAYGLRGTIYRSRDRGETWQRVATDLPATLTGATVLEDGRVVLVSQDGRAIVTADQADTFHPLRPARPTLFTDVVQVSRDRAVVSGLSGVQLVPLD